MILNCLGVDHPYDRVTDRWTFRQNCVSNSAVLPTRAISLLEVLNIEVAVNNLKSIQLM